MERIKRLKKMHQLAIITIQDPFAYSGTVMNFKNQLDMDNAVPNCNGKIRLFWNCDIDCIVKDQEEQQINCDFKSNSLWLLSMPNVKNI